MPRYKLFLLLLICPLVLLGQETEFEIHGSIKGPYAGKIYLFFDGNYRQKDSISAEIVNGKFYFKSHAALPILCRFHLDQTSYIQDVYIDSNKLFIDATNEFSIHDNDNNGKDTLNIFTIVETRGSALEKLKSDFEQSIKEVKGSGKSDEEKRNIHYQKLLEFISENPKSKVSQYLLGKASDLFYSQANQLAELIDTTLTNTFENRGVKNLLAQLKERGDRPKVDHRGSKFKFVTLKDTSDLTVNLRTYKGGYTLFVFWASWCGPCRAEHKELNQIFDKYKDKGFNMVGISLDNDKSKWKAVIRKDKLNWPQLIDIKAFEGKLAKTYEIDAIPANCLIDKTGKIIFWSLRPQEIDDKLKELL